MSRSSEWYRLTDDEQKIIESCQTILPIKVGAIAKRFDLEVKSSTLDSNISGMIKSDGNKTIIRINRHDVKQRQRFTLAHEIAHYLLHSEYIGDGITDDVLYRSSLSDILEAEANRLAAEIIMPWSMIVSRLDKHLGLKKEEQNEALAEEFDVSITAIKIRLGRM